MKMIIKSENINSQSITDQLKFYKEQFEYQHCQFDDCGSEVGKHWVLYDGELHCMDCFDYRIDTERADAEKEIEALTKKINDLKFEFNVE